MEKLAVIALLASVVLAGCVSYNADYNAEVPEANLRAVIEQGNPEACLLFPGQEVNESFAERYVRNLGDAGHGILFSDVCLISLVDADVNDRTITLCNNASERNYTFYEEGSYDIPGWEFCFRKAFLQYKSYPTMPTYGDITDISTCASLRDFKDECMALVAQNTNDSALCSQLSTDSRKKACIIAVSSQ